MIHHGSFAPSMIVPIAVSDVARSGLIVSGLEIASAVLANDRETGKIEGNE